MQVPKSGCPAALCEDVALLAPERGLAVLCDGASTSAFARHWASILADSFTFDLGDYLENAGIAEVAGWLTGCRERFSDEILETEWPWHALASLEAGSFSTLLGVRLDDSLSAIAVGDSCLMWDEGGRARGFPWEHAEDLAGAPVLVGSDPRAGPDESEIHRLGPMVPPADVLFLASDAIARTCLTGPDSWVELRVCDEQKDFEALILDWRTKGLVADDDSTVIRVRLISEGS